MLKISTRNTTEFQILEGQPVTAVRFYKRDDKKETIIYSEEGEFFRTNSNGIQLSAKDILKAYPHFVEIKDEHFCYLVDPKTIQYLTRSAPDTQNKQDVILGVKGIGRGQLRGVDKTDLDKILKSCAHFNVLSPDEVQARFYNGDGVYIHSDCIQHVEISSYQMVIRFAGKSSIDIQISEVENNKIQKRHSEQMSAKVNFILKDTGKPLEERFQNALYKKYYTDRDIDKRNYLETLFENLLPSNHQLIRVADENVTFYCNPHKYQMLRLSVGNHSVTKEKQYVAQFISSKNNLSDTFNEVRVYCKTEAERDAVVKSFQKARQAIKKQP